MNSSDASFIPVSALRSIWLNLGAIAVDSERKVWYTSNECYLTIGKLLNRMRDRSMSLGTDAEMRMWIEQQYYK